MIQIYHIPQKCFNMYQIHVLQILCIGAKYMYKLPIQSLLRHCDVQCTNISCIVALLIQQYIKWENHRINIIQIYKYLNISMMLLFTTVKNHDCEDMHSNFITNSCVYFAGFKLILRNMHKSRAVALRPITVCISYNLSRISVVNNSGNALRRQGT